jgi:hypothetical protein
MIKNHARDNFKTNSASVLLFDMITRDAKPFRLFARMKKPVRCTRVRLDAARMSAVVSAPVRWLGHLYSWERRPIYGSSF